MGGRDLIDPGKLTRSGERCISELAEIYDAAIRGLVTAEWFVVASVTSVETHFDRVLSALIEAHRKTKAQSGRLKLSNLGPNFKHALELARLLPLFETCPTESAAVLGF